MAQLHQCQNVCAEPEAAEPEPEAAEPEPELSAETDAYSGDEEGEPPQAAAAAAAAGDDGHTGGTTGVLSEPRADSSGADLKLAGLVAEVADLRQQLAEQKASKEAAVAAKATMEVETARAGVRISRFASRVISSTAKFRSERRLILACEMQLLANSNASQVRWCTCTRSRM